VLEVVALAGGAFSAQLVPQTRRPSGKSMGTAGTIWEHLRLPRVRDRSQDCAWAWLPSRLWARRCRNRSLRFRCWKRWRAARGCPLHRRGEFSPHWMRAGDVYAGDYELGSTAENIVTRGAMRSERLLSREKIHCGMQGCVDHHGRCRSGRGWSRCGLTVELIDSPNSAVIARLGWERLQRGETVSSRRNWKPTTSAVPMLKFSRSRRRDLLMPVTLRSAVFNDVPPILAVERQAPGAAHWTEEQYGKLLAAVWFVVAEQAGQICGFVCAQVVAGEWEIENLA